MGNHRSTRRWDSAPEILHALLTRNDSRVNADTERTDIWISVATGYPRITLPAVLAEAIADATGADAVVLGDGFLGTWTGKTGAERRVRFPTREEAVPHLARRAGEGVRFHDLRHCYAVDISRRTSPWEDTG